MSITVISHNFPRKLWIGWHVFWLEMGVSALASPFAGNFTPLEQGRWRHAGQRKSPDTHECSLSQAFASGARKRAIIYEFGGAEKTNPSQSLAAAFPLPTMDVAQMALGIQSTILERSEVCSASASVRQLPSYSPCVEALLLQVAFLTDLTRLRTNQKFIRQPGRNPAEVSTTCVTHMRAN